jgi:hypothetical protein
MNEHCSSHDDQFAQPTAQPDAQQHPEGLLHFRIHDYGSWGNVEIEEGTQYSVTVMFWSAKVPGEKERKIRWAERMCANANSVRQSAMTEMILG